VNADRHVGMARARQMIMLAERVDGRLGEQWGLLHEVVPPDELDAAVPCWRLDEAPHLEASDVIDEMATRVLDTSGHVEHVHADTSRRDHTVAALLRFPVPGPA
jgi:enoyl-CoA hydratase/carnithine racemase